jgi:flavin-dependent dehydrogenase
VAVRPATGSCPFFQKKRGSAARRFPDPAWHQGSHLAPPAKNRDRFNLEKDAGAAHLFVGEATRGKFGGGFLYTNRESLSLGVVVGIGDLVEKEPALAAPDFLEDFKKRPEIAPLVRDGETVEYSAHVIPRETLGIAPFAVTASSSRGMRRDSP